MKQTSLTDVIESSFRSHERRMVAFMSDHVNQYRVNAQFIAPDPGDKEAIFTRLAFAILSANCKFDQAVKALDYVLQRHRRDKDVTGHDMKLLAMVPAKAKYVNHIRHKIFSSGQGWYLRWSGETWSEYRERLIQVKGLGRAKASFAACLLYPLEADLACVDTWIQKVFLGHTGFKDLRRTDYEAVESKIRQYAHKFGVSTFLAQWMIWDHARGGKVNDHAIFPGSHK